MIECRSCGRVRLFKSVAAHVAEYSKTGETLAERICSTCGSDGAIIQIRHGEFVLLRPMSGLWRDFFLGGSVIIHCPECFPGLTSNPGCV